MMNPIRTTLAAAFAVASLGVGQAAYAQQTETPLRGTTPIADDAPDMAAHARVTLEQANAAALARVTGGAITSTELDEEDGFLVYEVELRRGANEVDVYVDAGDGSVLRVEEEPADND